MSIRNRWNNYFLLSSAMNIDLKAMDDEFYQKVCKGTLQPVLQTIIRAKQSCHIKLTNLVIPNQNDSDAHFQRLTDCNFRNTGADTALHFSPAISRAFKWTSRQHTLKL